MNAIVKSAWRCRGNWYHKVWAVMGERVFEIAPHYRGYRSEEKVREMADAAAEMIRHRYPVTEDLPEVFEHSEEWKALLPVAEKEAA